MHGLKDQYDLAFSIGAVCACSQSLRRAGMQYASFPYDWVVLPAVPERMRLLVDGFRDFMPLDKMVRSGVNEENHHDIYVNSETGMLFVHDFPQGIPIEQVIGEVREKYRRRAERLLGMLERGGDILLLYLTIPNESRLPDSEFVESLEIISRRFPNCRFDLLCLSQKSTGFSGVDNPSPHLFRADFDYQSKVPGSENIADEHVVAGVLKKIVRAVRDYRTAAERARYKVEKRKKEYALFKAENRVQYLINKMTWKLYKHFKNSLERRGFKFND